MASAFLLQKCPQFSFPHLRHKIDLRADTASLPQRIGRKTADLKHGNAGKTVRGQLQLPAAAFHKRAVFKDGYRRTASYAGAGFEKLRLISGMQRTQRRHSRNHFVTETAAQRIAGTVTAQPALRLPAGGDDQLCCPERLLPGCYLEIPAVFYKAGLRHLHAFSDRHRPERADRPLERIAHSRCLIRQRVDIAVAVVRIDTDRLKKPDRIRTVKL